MSYPLLLRGVLERARQFSPGKEIVTRVPDGLQRTTYGEMASRANALGHALLRLGVQRGDRVGTLGWNHFRHLELYFAVPCLGAVLHTINLRLFQDQVAYIIQHAEDRVLFLDPDVVPLLERLHGQIPSVRDFVIMCDRESMPATTLPGAVCYEDLLDGGSRDYVFPDDLDEDLPAAMCYTSATTGNPKGVQYSHRMLFLHTMAKCLTDTIAVSERDTILPVVPMFHVNAWGLPWAAAFAGAKLVLPGARPDSKALAELIQQEGVTLAAGVPTVWMGVLDELRARSYDFSTIRALEVGGAAVPRALMEAYDQLGITVMHAYGMTEAAPLTHVGRLRSSADDRSTEERYRLRVKQGMLAHGLEMRLVGEHGENVPWDGESLGELALRGPWVATEYYRDARTAETFREGWYYTGDVGSVDAEGYLQLADRTKDLVKSGGEWISSVDIENHLMAHASVQEAAVIAVPHARWQERPVACVALRSQSAPVSEEDLKIFLSERIVGWWMPDRVVFIDEVPKTSVGKFDKKVLRARFKDLLGGA
ncbi:MAG: long-chain fatty acid--CoA ligase [Chloroflexota bacterium]